MAGEIWTSLHDADSHHEGSNDAFTIMRDYEAASRVRVGAG